MDKLFPSVKFVVPQSPTPHLINSNQLPTDEEANQIRACIALAQSIREALDWEQTCRQGIQLKNVGSSERPYRSVPSVVLRYRKHVVQRFILQHAGIVSSVRRIPKDVLREIASHTMTLDSPLSPSSALPFLMAHVCSTWRRLIVGTPIFWTTLPTFFLTSHRTRRQDYVDMVQQLLARSQNLTLRVEVTGDFRDSSSSHPVLLLLTEHSDRWRNVTISTHLRYFDCLRCIKNRLSALESASIRVYGEGLHSMDLFESTPKLRSFSSSDFAGILSGAPLLKVYQTASLHPNIPTQLRLSASTLQTLRLNGTASSSLQDDFIFPVLRQLQVNILHQYSNASYLQHFQVPCIEELSVQGHPEDALPSILRELSSMISQSGSPTTLKTLSLFGLGPEDAQYLRDLLLHTPALEHLEIQSENAIFNRLISPNPNTLVPSLKTLVLGMPESLVYQHKFVLNQIAQSRCENRSGHMDSIPGALRQLDKFHISLDRTGPSGLSAAIDALDAFGLPASNCLERLFDLGKFLSTIPFPTKTHAVQETLFEVKWKGRILGAFRELQDMPITIKNACWLQRSGIPDVLVQMTKMDSTPGTLLDHCRQMAAGLLKDWEVSLKGLIPHRRWFLGTNSRIVYLSADDPTRNTASSYSLISSLPVCLKER